MGDEEEVISVKTTPRQKAVAAKKAGKVDTDARKQIPAKVSCPERFLAVY